MICLGFEGTAHTIGAGIVDDSKVLANESKVFHPESGIHPREAANFHAKNIADVLRDALDSAKISPKEIELVAFSQGPGLGPCLRTVATGARAFSLSLKKPIIGVNHCIAHLEIGRATTKCKDPVLLYVSGGNTQVISFSNKRYRVFGETLDIGIGNMLDKFGRLIGIPFPAGPENGAAGSGLCDYWKNSAFSAIGTEPPVGATMSAAEKLGMMWEAAGFKVGDVAWSPATGSESSRQGAAWYYESANFVYICSHGFFYWYVPTGIRTFYYRETGAGGAFDVAHVKLMNFGPSVIWTDSCVTGRIDGLEMYNCISNAFLHAGFNCYFGGTRSMWGTFVPIPDQYSGEKFGSLIAIYLYGYMTGYMWESQSIQPAPVEDVSTGVAFMLAKNYFVVTQGTDGPGENDDTIEAVILHGDPAFNPYEPNHEGMGA